jgi:hypothetical protein
MLVKQQLIVHDNVLLNIMDFDLYQVFLNVAIYLKVEQVHEDFLNYYCLLLILVIFLNQLIQLKNLNYCH